MLSMCYVPQYQRAEVLSGSAKVHWKGLSGQGEMKNSREVLMNLSVPLEELCRADTERSPWRISCHVERKARDRKSVV